MCLDLPGAPEELTEQEEKGPLYGPHRTKPLYFPSLETPGQLTTSQWCCVGRGNGPQNAAALLALPPWGALPEVAVDPAWGPAA